MHVAASLVVHVAAGVAVSIMHNVRGARQAAAARPSQSARVYMEIFPKHLFFWDFCDEPLNAVPRSVPGCEQCV